MTGPGGLSVWTTDSLHPSQKDPLYVYGAYGTDTDSASAGWSVHGTFTYNVPAGYGAATCSRLSQFHNHHPDIGTDIPLTTTAFTITIPSNSAPPPACNDRYCRVRHTELHGFQRHYRNPC